MTTPLWMAGTQAVADTSGWGEEMRDRYEREVIDPEALAAELAERVREWLHEDLLLAAIGSERGDWRAWDALTDREQEALHQSTPRLRAPNHRVRYAIARCLDDITDDIERVGVLLDVWPSFETWSEQQGGAA